MSELIKIVLTSALTITGGILVITIGRIIEKFVIEPIHALRRTIGETANSLIFYANIYGNPSKETPEEREINEEVQKALRRLAAQLMARSNAVPRLRVCQFKILIPSHGSVKEAAGKLISISNYFRTRNANDERIIKMRKEIEKLLRIDART